MVAHTDIRKWSEALIGIQKQSAYQTPVVTFTQFAWAEEVMFNESPQVLDFDGAWGRGFRPKDAGLVTHYLPIGRVRMAATVSNAAWVLPLMSDGILSGTTLTFVTAQDNYFSIAVYDHASGRTIRLEDCRPTQLTLDCSTTTGVLFLDMTFLAGGRSRFLPLGLELSMASLIAVLMERILQVFVAG